MKTTPDPDTLPTGLGRRIVTTHKPVPAAPRRWAPLPCHPGYESDGSTVRKVDSPRS